ncbi:MAG: hypothetical protein KGJ89_04895 [Patescibacteria group bacterium]|nr:hypothetical protein [Patescibacteria group bacterium]MDE2015545.1 hypothetical protein [Patescibacteria group bacterium]MDE2227259.1 hypothetical protein [Patescibacteria group bacterium]
MDIDFYDMNLRPPDKSIAEAFGSDEELIRLEGGQGTSYVSGNIVLKPSVNINKESWVADTFDKLLESNDVRFARPIRSIDKSWSYKNYVAWSFLKGEHAKGKYRQKLSASQAFHRLLKDIERPGFFDFPPNSWSAADQVVWVKQKFNYDKEFLDLINQITPHLKPLDLPNQLVHGDLSGNFLLGENLPPAIIDFSPVWAPNGFAEGVLLADAIAWEDAAPESLEIFNLIPDIHQFAWRGVLRRIVEQAEHIKWFGKDKSEAVEDARVFQKAIDYLKDNSS